jgi:hypothetical protein
MFLLVESRKDEAKIGAGHFLSDNNSLMGILVLHVVNTFLKI